MTDRGSYPNLLSGCDSWTRRQVCTTQASSHCQIPARNDQPFASIVAQQCGRLRIGTNRWRNIFGVDRLTGALAGQQHSAGFGGIMATNSRAEDQRDR
ncbi:MAG: hypothetical protein ABL912_07080 [Novosphingobium sp.]